MGKITRPGKIKLKNAPKRPAWLYPEGTIYGEGDDRFVVARNYNGSARSKRYWKEY